MIFAMHWLVCDQFTLSIVNINVTIGGENTHRCIVHEFCLNQIFFFKIWVNYEHKQLLMFVISYFALNVVFSIQQSIYEYVNKNMGKAIFTNLGRDSAPMDIKTDALTKSRDSPS